jgi:hypothetical protein
MPKERYIVCSDDAVVSFNCLFHLIARLSNVNSLEIPQYEINRFQHVSYYLWQGSSKTDLHFLAQSLPVCVCERIN